MAYTPDLPMTRPAPPYNVAGDEPPVRAEEDPIHLYLNSFGSEGGGMEPPPPTSALSAGSSASLMSVDEEEKLRIYSDIYTSYACRADS